MRLHGPFPAIVLLPILSGCFSSLLLDDMRLPGGRDDSIPVTAAAQLRVMHCPREGRTLAYRVAAQNRPLFLFHDRAGWVLGDIPPAPEPRNGRTDASMPALADTLELVLGSSPEGFFPSDLEGPRPRVFLRLPAPDPENPGREAAPLANESELLLSRRGRMEWRQVVIRTDRYLERMQTARTLRKSPWFLLTVPADFVTSPFQLFGWYVFRNGVPIGCTGNCH